MDQKTQTPWPALRQYTPPYDILLDVCSFLGNHELSLVALLNRTWNEAATTTLYREIDLVQTRAIWRCVKTLSRSPETTSFGRELAAVPRSIRLRFPPYIIASDECGKTLGVMLLQTLPRLINLHSLSCNVTFLNVLDILLWTTETRRTPLRTLALTGDIIYRDHDHIGFGNDVPLDLWPTLSSLELDVYATYDPVPYATFLEHTILRSQNHLRVLSLDFGPGFVKSDSPILELFKRLPVFKCLEELRTMLPGNFLALPCFTQAPCLKSLCVLDWDGSLAWSALCETDYAHLETLACPPQLLGIHVLDALLPNTQGRRRQIHTLRFGNTTYERYCGGFRASWCMWDIAAPAVLAHMAYSGVPIRCLGIHVMDISILLGPDVKLHLQHLERLDLTMQWSQEVPELDPFTLGVELIANMPRLHTFLISDAPYKLHCDPRAGFAWAGDEAFQRQVLADFDGRSSVLRRVALTCEFEWEKRADGQWHAWGHLFPELPLPLGAGGVPEDMKGLVEQYCT